MLRACLQLFLKYSREITYCWILISNVDPRNADHSPNKNKLVDLNVNILYNKVLAIKGQLFEEEIREEMCFGDFLFMVVERKKNRC